MTTLNITDFRAFLNTQIAEHEQLAEQLVQIQHVLDFTANSDLKNPDPVQLNAQFIAIEKLLKAVQVLQAGLKTALVNYLPVSEPLTK